MAISIFMKRVTGILHPKLFLDYKLENPQSELIIKDSKNVLETELIGFHYHGRKIVSAIVDKKEKKIYLYEKTKNALKEVAVIRNTLWIRIFNKFLGIWEKIWSPLSQSKTAVVFLWKEYHFLIPKFLWKEYKNRFKNKIKSLLRINYYNPFRQKDYLKWIKNCEEKPIYQKLEYQPLISILIPVYNINRKYLSECLDSILNQHYQNFEICITDDASTLLETKETLEEYVKRDSRIKVHYRKENGHIAKATNDALKMAKGEFIALMDNDDVLTPNALYEMVYVLNQNKEYDMIYSDEDKIDMNNLRCEPHFKPDYSPDSLLGGNYICHFEILRTSIVREIKGFRSEFVGAQDFDLFLRFVEKTTPEKIYHISKILYHWRKVPGSTAETVHNKEYAILNGKKAVEEALKRRNLKGEVIVPIESTHYIVNYLYEKEPKVSIIIPTRDYVETLKKCVDSIYQKTKYQNFEILIANNDSVEKETYDFFKTYQQKYQNFRVIDTKGEFNYSKINNDAVKESIGEYLLFLNNDTEVCNENWLHIMTGYAMQDHIGAVGAKLFYPDDTIQHGGVILGLGGSAGHAFLHKKGTDYGFYGRLLVPYNYSSVTAACMMVKKEKFLEVNGFDETLKVSFNDVDFNLKLLEKGYYNIFLPQVEMIHYESKTRGFDTTKEKWEKSLKEKEILQKRWKKYLENDPFYNKNFSLRKDFVLERK